MTARWCGACGASLTAVGPGPPRPDPHGERRVPGDTLLVVLGATLVVGLIGLAVWAGGGDGPRGAADGEVAVPGQDLLAEFDDPGTADRVTSAGSRMSCAPAGCQVWRVDEPTGQDVLASDELVLHVRRELTIAYDSATGRVRWQRPTPSYASRTARRSALSPAGLAFVHTEEVGLVEEPTPHLTSRPVTVSVHDPRDGAHRVDVELEPGEVQQSFWVGDRLVVVVVGLDRTSVRTFGITPDGEVAWRLEDTARVRPVPETTTLLVSGASRTALVDVADGRPRWEVPGTLLSGVDLPGPMVVREGREGRVRVIDPGSGAVRRVLDLGGAHAAVVFGPWVLVSEGDRVRVLDPTTGDELFARPDPTPAAAGEDGGRQRPGLLRVSTAVQAGDRVVVAWADATTDEGIELAVHGLDGSRRGTVTVPVDAVMGGAIGLHAVAGRDGVVLAHLTTGAGPEGSVAAIDVVARDVLGVADGRLIASKDDLLVIRQDDGLVLLGPTGQLQVRHVRDVAALDPLVVHGVGGIMRLDRSLLAGEG